MSDQQQAPDIIKASHQVMCLRDVKGGYFMPPFTTKSIPTAIRSLTDEAQNQEKSMLYRFPQDYQVYRLGQFYEDSGILDTLQTPELICEVSDLVQLKVEKV